MGQILFHLFMDLLFAGIGRLVLLIRFRSRKKLREYLEQKPQFSHRSEATIVVLQLITIIMIGMLLFFLAACFYAIFRQMLRLFYQDPLVVPSDISLKSDLRRHTHPFSLIFSTPNIWS